MIYVDILTTDGDILTTIANDRSHAERIVKGRTDVRESAIIEQFTLHFVELLDIHGSSANDIEIEDLS